MVTSIIRAAVASIVVLLAVAGGSPTTPAIAADVHIAMTAKQGLRTLPFPRSERAQSVWAGGACRTECGAYCAWGQTACLSPEGLGPAAQGQCLKLTDDCDRSCQRSCRTSGGPWLPLDF